MVSTIKMQWAWLLDSTECNKLYISLYLKNQFIWHVSSSLEAWWGRPALVLLGVPSLSASYRAPETCGDPQRDPSAWSFLITRRLLDSLFHGMKTWGFPRYGSHFCLSSYSLEFSSRSMRFLVVSIPLCLSNPLGFQSKDRSPIMDIPREVQLPWTPQSLSICTALFFLILK